MSIIDKIFFTSTILFIVNLFVIKIITSKDYNQEGLDNIEWFLSILFIALAVIMLGSIIAKIWSV